MILEEMKKVDIRTVAREDLVDMREVHIPETNNVEELVNYLLNNNINWYVHRRGEIVVQNKYSDEESINDIFGIMVSST